VGAPIFHIAWVTKVSNGDDRRFSKETVMNNSMKSAAVGFAVGLAFAAVAVQAAQTPEHEPSTAPTAKQAPAPMQPMRMMMADPAMRQKMMQQMGQCREMMSTMMEHMGHPAAMPKQSPAPSKH